MPNPRQDPDASLLETAMSLGLPVSASDTTDVKVAWALKELAATRSNPASSGTDVSFYGSYEGPVVSSPNYNTLPLPPVGTTRAMYNIEESQISGSSWNVENLINAGVLEVGFSFYIDNADNPAQFYFRNGENGQGFMVTAVNNGQFCISIAYNSESGEIFIASGGYVPGVISL